MMFFCFCDVGGDVEGDMLGELVGCGRCYDKNKSY
jgi:hypothetical protein